MSERRACTIVRVDRKTIRYRSRRPADEALRARMRELAAERRRFGYRRLHVLLRREGLVRNRKRTQRLYREEGLTVRRRRGRKRATGARAPLLLPVLPNARWSIDFVHDQLACGRRFRILNVIDDVTKECLAAVADTSISGKRAARELAALVARRGRHARLGEREPHRLALHRTGQADAERHLRELQRAHAGRALERDAVLRHRPRPSRHRALGGRLQPAPPPFEPSLSDPGRLAAALTATGARRSNPDQLRRSPVAPSAPLRQSNPETLACAG
jgi:putative transposase